MFIKQSNQNKQKVLDVAFNKFYNLCPVPIKKEWTDFSSYLEDICVIVPYYPEIASLDLGYDYYIGVYPETPQSIFLTPSSRYIVLILSNLRIWKPYRCLKRLRKT